MNNSVLRLCSIAAFLVAACAVRTTPVFSADCDFTAPFSNFRPVLEDAWGGNSIANPDAVGSPFPTSAQVLTAPLVANLDDDNGDGVIDELDIPEIIFTSYCGTQFAQDGILRAIHGGGPNRGADFFATCGSNYWREGDPLFACSCATADLNPRAGLAVGDLDGDGVSEIVAMTEAVGGLVQARVYSNTGEIITTSLSFNAGGPTPAPAIANLDMAGLAEVIVGRHVFSFERHNSNLQFLDHFEGSLQNGVNGLGPVSCAGRLTNEPRLEVIAGTTSYLFPARPSGITRRADCTGTEVGEEFSWCHGALLVHWDGQTVNGSGAVPNANREGLCAVADVLGADQLSPPGPNNPLDGVPEVVTVSNGVLQIFNGQNGILLRIQNLAAGNLGGAPTVADFDGDGFPEVGIALGIAYVLVDLQATGSQCPAWPNTFLDSVAGLQGNSPRTPPPATCTQDTDCGDLNQFACNEVLHECVCLHNGWRRLVEDDASRATGSTAFDFNGDGSAEVLYNDECYLRMYSGLDGAIVFKQSSPSRTAIEYPVIADVDNDGAAEFVYASSNESGACSIGNDFPNGISVIGDLGGTFRSARRIWNQHTYHNANVEEDGSIPLHEGGSWQLDNSYRANSCVAPLCPFTCGDFNGDAGVDLFDFFLFAQCFGSTPPSSPACLCSDLDVDQTVDLIDYGLFHGLIGVGTPHMPPNCP